MDGFAAFVHEQSLALIGLTVFAGLLLARELGGCAHRRAAGPIDDPDDETADKGYILSDGSRSDPQRD